MIKNDKKENKEEYIIDIEKFNFLQDKKEIWLDAENALKKGIPVMLKSKNDISKIKDLNHLEAFKSTISIADIFIMAKILGNMI